MTDKPTTAPKYPELDRLGWHHVNGKHVAVVNFVSITGMVNYRIKGSRKCYYSQMRNFLKNYKQVK